MPSFSQKVQTTRPGDRATASDRNHLIAMIKRMVVGGRGILVKPVGDQLVVEARGAAMGRSGVSADDVEWMKTAESKAELEEPVAEVWFGRVTAGAQKGMVCVRNPDNDGWDALNFFE